AGGIAEERLGPASGVEDTGGVVGERLGPVGGVVAAGGVIQERLEADGSVVVAGGPNECVETDGSVVVAGGVIEERLGAESRVRKPGTRRCCLAKAHLQRAGPPSGITVIVAAGRVQRLPPARGGGQHQNEWSRYCHERSDWLHRSLRAPVEPAKKH